MKVSIKFNGLDSLLKTIEKVDNDCTVKIDKVLDVVADKGQKRAQWKYALAENDDNPIPDVKVLKGNLTRTIEAKGRGVAFIEFGTGILKQEHPMQTDSKLASAGLVKHGQYGWGNGANLNGWWYFGKHTYGIDAQRCLYDTGKELEADLPNIVKEVFK